MTHILTHTTHIHAKQAVGMGKVIS
uniref:Uncharacterized protein n=1 Tax=Anguilla anguilla TaxID=7936 RepID=A0A0E9W0C9_ANGAN